MVSELIGRLTLRERVTARRAVNDIISASTQTLLSVRERLIRQGSESTYVEMIDMVLSKRGVTP